MPAERTDGGVLAGPIPARLESILGVKSDEILLAFLAFAYFFLLLCGYFIIRPIRDNMGIEFGTTRLPYLFGYIFAVMLAAVPVVRLGRFTFSEGTHRPDRLRLLRRANPGFLFSAAVFDRSNGDRACLLRLGECVQSVRRIDLLELHG